MIKCIKYKELKGVLGILFFVSMIGLVSSSCDTEFELPEAGSIADKTPPQANFVASPSDADYLTYNFANLSTSATNYLWNFGDGNTSIDQDATNTYPGVGSYEITLKVSDDLGVSMEFTDMITIVEPIVPEVNVPKIIASDFENGDAKKEPLDIDDRQSWTSGDLKRVGTKSSIIQISTTAEGDSKFAAKLPTSEERLGYQVLNDLTPNTKYVLTFYYRFRKKVDEVGVLNVAMVKPLASWDVTTLTDDTVAAVAIEETEDNTSDFTLGSLEFDSGANTSLAILFYNELEEINVDTFDLNVL